MSRVILSAMFALFVSQCGKKVADLSFADSSELHVEVGEKFDVTVNVENIDMDNLDDDLDWTDHDGSPMDREGKPYWDSLYVTSKLMVKGKEGDILSRGYSDTRIKDKGGLVKIEGYYFTETCTDDCRIVFGLRINGICMADGGCESAQVEPVDEISKAVVVTPSSYAAKVERVSGKNIKLTVTKDGKPLANSSVEVSAYIGCS